MSPDLVLDPGQSEVAAAAASDRQIVLAGPGSGKTQVVGRLVENLLDEGVGPDEILLLSFSRAAVSATKGRIDAGGGEVDVTTIDSLAARLIGSSSEVEPQRLGFDRTVREATRLLSNGESQIVDGIAHLVIDEAQDVVGVRSTFVLALMDFLVARGAGFTLLGDPMQALYDFQTADDPRALDIFEEVRLRFRPTERTLTSDYRSRNKYLPSAARRRVELLAATPGDRRRLLERSIVEVPPLGVLDIDSAGDIAAWTGTTALLCDTNIRAALAADLASCAGLFVEIAPRREDPALPTWLGELFQDRERESLTRDEFIIIDGSDSPGQSQDRWRTLVDVTRSRREIRMSDLTASLRSTFRCRAVERVPECLVVASTVHRAKGLEFDNVVLVDPELWSRPDDDPDTIARRAFVALTRGCDRITRVRAEDPKGWQRHTRAGGPSVWIKRLPRRGRPGPCAGVLLEPWMARSLGPSAADLRACVQQGVSWRRSDEHVSVDGDVLPTWTAFTHEGIAVASTGEAFGRLVAELTDPSLASLPVLEGGRVEGLETVTGVAPTSGRGRHGFWVGARISGPLTFDRERKGIE